MHDPGRTPEQLAEDLLGRRFDELEAEEQNVLRRISSGALIDLDADEEAALHAVYSDRLADRVAAVGGSWSFIIAFGVVLLAWMLVNSRILEAIGVHPFDAYPYIFLNLIMMSQNRQAAKDRIAARHDYEVNLRTQLEIIRLQRRIERLVAHMRADVDRGTN